MLAKGQSGYVHPVTFADKLAEQAEPKGPNIGPSAEPYYTKQASRADIDRLLGTHKSDLPALQTAIGNRTDDNFEKLATLFGRQRAQEYMAMLEQEAAGRNTYNKVVENSQTPARLLAVKRQEGSDLPTAGESLWGNVKAATKYVYDKATAEHRAAVRDRIAEIMAADNPAAMQAHVDQLLRIGAKRDARDAMASILAQRTFLGGATAGVIPKQAEAQY
jgi:head-tail adaptor